ncbi:hypothetical protein Pla175_09280 [Pirellulimonas nuda]|uniref:Pyrrolo-quinoline quinone repeat domain-containing protein n=1 Tax=Pirellulimonas nuda TaxID=2528009 RepID=A0A518D7X2_9BACT|nr:PQQ-binding-like beta-propeller repeat protein [Pirellulimonas nuda]QDU87563.1 hypothetical protein Pla175_09280 [Pirellulimonas nuda]
MPQRTRSLRCYATALALAAMTTSVDAQLFAPPFGAGAAETFPPAAPTIAKAPGEARRRLMQVQALIDEQLWEEAIDGLDELAASGERGLVETRPDVYVPIADVCQSMLARLPADALAIYRSRVDAGAERQLARGVAERDPALLRVVTGQWLASSAGDEALAALGELALEAGAPGQARAYFRMVSPLLVGPTGADIPRALRGIDLAEHADHVRRIWLESPRPEELVVYPDASIAPAGALGRMIVASIRERDFDRAQRELELLTLLWPDATGTIAGRDGPLAGQLEEALAAARDWPSASPDATRVPPLLGRVWAKPVELLHPNQPAIERLRAMAPGIRFQAGVLLAAREESPPAAEVVAADGLAIFRDGGLIRAVSLAAGQPAVTPEGVLLDDGRGGAVRDAAAGAGGGPLGAGVGNRLMIDPRLRRLVVQPNMAPSVFAATAAPPVVAGHVVYAQEPAYGLGVELRGLDLRREAILSFKAAPPEGWAFAGPPWVEGPRLVVAIQQSEVRAQVGLACYARDSARLLWQTPLCSGAAGGSAASGQPVQIAVDQGLAVVNTNVGAVACVELQTGNVRWLRTYARVAPGSEGAAPGACFVARGMAYVAPSDSDSILAIDFADGTLRWRRPAVDGGGQLLGVVDGVLVGAGQKVFGIDAASGSLRYAWPDAERSGILGAGAAALAGGELFWAAGGELLTMDPRTGTQVRLPVPLPWKDAGPTRLAPSRAGILIANARQLELLGPVPATREPAEEGRLSIRSMGTRDIE